MNQHEAEKVGDGKPKTMPPASVMTRLILIMVWRKLIRNPNTYSSLIGLTWSLISFRYVFSFLRHIPGKPLRMHGSFLFLIALCLAGCC